MKPQYWTWFLLTVAGLLVVFPAWQWWTLGGAAAVVLVWVAVRMALGIVAGSREMRALQAKAAADEAARRSATPPRVVGVLKWPATTPPADDEAGWNSRFESIAHSMPDLNESHNRLAGLYLVPNYQPQGRLVHRVPEES